jgi:2-keto-4-pentenoate hydratase
VNSLRDTARGAGQPVAMDDEELVTAATARLAEAQATGAPCAPVRDLIGSDGRLAYDVQQAGIATRTARGARVVGRKVGLTSAAVQAQLGVDQPDYGTLLDTMEVPTGGVVTRGSLLQPRAEAELAFVLATDLADPGEDLERVRAAIDHAVAAIEIVDSRITGWDITFGDTVADNGSSARYVVGEDRLDLDTFDAAAVTMTMTRDGEVVSSGTGAACLGDPLRAVAWLATTLDHVGTPLRAGDLVLSGALGPMVAADSGTTFHAHIEHDGRPLASVSVSFSDLDPQEQS